MRYALKNPNRFPKKRLWKTTKRIMVGYTVEPDQDGKFWTLRYHKVSGGSSLALVKQMAFTKRWKAKERAYQWWCKTTGKPVSKSPYYHQIPERNESQEPDQEPIVTATSCGRPRRKITMNHLDAQQTSEAVAQGREFWDSNFPGTVAARKIRKITIAKKDLDNGNQTE
jgi:hypothetical protein